MTYHFTKNTLLVQKLLVHKRIQNTMKYTHLVHFKDDEFDVARRQRLRRLRSF